METLWVCHVCEQIGNAEEALKHTQETGHGTHELDQESSDAIRELWAKDGRPQHEPRIHPGILNWLRIWRAKPPS